MYVLAPLVETSLLASELLAGELIDDIRNLFGQVESLLLMALGIFAIWFVFKEFMHSRTIAAFITAAFTVGFVLFVAYNVDWLRSMLGDEIKSAAPTVQDDHTNNHAGDQVDRIDAVPTPVEVTPVEVTPVDHTANGTHDATTSRDRR